MKNLIEKIRQKPHHEKNRIILFSILTVTGLLIIAWVIIGIPSRNKKDDGDIINNFSESFEESKDALPDLFPEENNQ